jgi:hypothetical protein
MNRKTAIVTFKRIPSVPLFTFQRVDYYYVVHSRATGTGTDRYWYIVTVVDTRTVVEERARLTQYFNPAVPVY